jgi:hypothetical protein
MVEKYNNFVITFKDKEVDTIKEFVDKAEKVDGVVLVSSGLNCFDGSSLMGMITLKDCNLLIVRYPQKAKDFEKYLTDTFYLPYIRNQFKSYL